MGFVYLNQYSYKAVKLFGRFVWPRSSVLFGKCCCSSCRVYVRGYLVMGGVLVCSEGTCPKYLYLVVYGVR